MRHDLLLKKNELLIEFLNFFLHHHVMLLCLSCNVIIINKVAKKFCHKEELDYDNTLSYQEMVIIQ